MTSVEKKGLEALTAEEALKLKSYYDEVLSVRESFVRVGGPSGKREKMLKLHGQLTEATRELLLRKNHHYSGSPADPEYDFFFNFRKRGAAGILTRLDDKLARLETFVKEGSLEVADEKLEDTVCDIINCPKQ